MDTIKRSGKRLFFIYAWVLIGALILYQVIILSSKPLISLASLIEPEKYLSYRSIFFFGFLSLAAFLSSIWLIINFIKWSIEMEKKILKNIVLGWLAFGFLGLSYSLFSFSAVGIMIMFGG